MSEIRNYSSITEDHIETPNHTKLSIYQANPMMDEGFQQLKAHSFLSRSRSSRSQSPKSPKVLDGTNRSRQKPLQIQLQTDGKNNYKEFKPQRNVFVKAPFKHAAKPLSEIPFDDSKKPIDPSHDLIEKTLKGIEQFIFKYELDKQNSTKNIYLNRRNRHNSHGPGLKPLNVVNKGGPSMKSCVGIVKEPRNANAQLKELYDKKMQLLAERRNQMLKYQAAKELAALEPPASATPRGSYDRENNNDRELELEDN